jgi:hypothetical protein
MLKQPAKSGWVGLLLVLILQCTTPVSAQNPTLPAAPVPVLPPAAIAPGAPPTPLAYTAPPPMVVGPPTVIGPTYDPGADGWGPYGQPSTCPGWFFDTEIAFVFPSLKFRLTNDQPLPVTGATLNVPAVSLATTVQPTFEVGYGLGDSAGYFALATSFLYSEGTGTRVLSGVDYAVRTRLNVNWLDLDYGTAAYEFAPRYMLSWRIGARVADVFFDSQATNGVVTAASSNQFIGAGPHARLDLERRIVPVPGLSLFGRLDGVLYVGQVRQHYNLDILALHDGSSVQRTQTVPYINLQAGISYSPPSIPALKLTTGYLFEDYFDVGRLGISPQGQVSHSRGEMWWHGAFLRAQYDF